MEERVLLSAARVATVAQAKGPETQAVDFGGNYTVLINGNENVGTAALTQNGESVNGQFTLGIVGTFAFNGEVSNNGTEFETKFKIVIPKDVFGSKKVKVKGELKLILQQDTNLAGGGQFKSKLTGEQTIDVAFERLP